MKNKSLQKKIKNYAGVATAVLAAGATQAQSTIYVEVNDTLSGEYDSLLLDFNQDGVYDAMAFFSSSSSFSSSSFSSYFIAGLSSYNSALRVEGRTEFVGIYSGYVIDKNPAGDTVDVTNDFVDGSYALLFGKAYESYYGVPVVDIEIGDWHEQGDGFVAIELTESGNIHYGWIRLDVDTANGRMIVKDHLIVTTPDGAIETGAMNPVSTEDIEHFSNAQLYLSEDRLILNSDMEGIIHYTLYSMTGALVEQRVIPAVFDMSMSHISSGAYVVVLQNNGQRMEKKIVIN